MEVRRRKSEFRRIAYKFREEGERAYFNHEYIKIGDQTYYENDLRSILEKYRHDRLDVRRDAPLHFRPQPNTRMNSHPQIATTVQPDTLADQNVVEGAGNKDSPHRNTEASQTLGAAVKPDLPADTAPVT